MDFLFFLTKEGVSRQSPVASSQSPAGMKGMNPNWKERFSFKDQQNRITSGLFMFAYYTKLFSRVIGVNYSHFEKYFVYLKCVKRYIKFYSVFMGTRQDLKYINLPVLSS